MPSYIQGYSCFTSAGEGADKLWSALIESKILRDTEGVCRIPEEPLSERLYRLVKDFSLSSGTFGILFASTKGAIEDVIWNASDENLSRDTLTPVLDQFLSRTGLRPKESLCVSNACASSHGAFYLANRWLENHIVDQVLVISADTIGPFIFQGFKSLGALSPTGARPFSLDRDGLQLGEAATAVLLSQKKTGFQLSAVEIDTEGHSVTRPSPSGKSLERACSSVLQGKKVDVILAHGTATKANDITEDKVFCELGLEKTPVTATKGCVGHTLGVSGSIDLIAAIEMLKRQTVFPISGTEKTDPSFQSAFVVGKRLSRNLQSVLVTSLGFGGTNAALLVESK